MSATAIFYIIVPYVRNQMLDWINMPYDSDSACLHISQNVVIPMKYLYVGLPPSYQFVASVVYMGALMSAYLAKVL